VFLDCWREIVIALIDLLQVEELPLANLSDPNPQAAHAPEEYAHRNVGT
jgi:hypothetical protein